MVYKGIQEEVEYQLDRILLDIQYLLVRRYTPSNVGNHLARGQLSYWPFKTKSWASLRTVFANYSNSFFILKSFFIIYGLCSYNTLWFPKHNLLFAKIFFTKPVFLNLLLRYWNLWKFVDGLEMIHRDVKIYKIMIFFLEIKKINIKNALNEPYISKKSLLFL